MQYIWGCSPAAVLAAGGAVSCHTLRLRRPDEVLGEWGDFLVVRCAVIHDFRFGYELQRWAGLLHNAMDSGQSLWSQLEVENPQAIVGFLVGVRTGACQLYVHTGLTAQADRRITDVGVEKERRRAVPGFGKMLDDEFARVLGVRRVCGEPVGHDGEFVDRNGKAQLDGFCGCGLGVQ